MREHKPYIIYANALLSDGEILFWYTGRVVWTLSDFFRALNDVGIDAQAYFANHDIQRATKAFYATKETNNYVFEREAVDWYSQWMISEDFVGIPPYRRFGER